MGAPYNVLDVCRYVVKYSNEKDYGVSNLKLQKLLYYIQAYFLISPPEHQACFEEEIEAWAFGPVVPEAYAEYRRFGGLRIPDMSTYTVLDKNNIWNSRRYPINFNIISDKHKEMIGTVIDMFSKDTAFDLVKITHEHDTWKNVYKPSQNNIITKKSIREFFDGRAERESKKQ